MWLILALMTAVFWAIGSVVIKKAVGQMPKKVVYFSNALFFLIGWLIYWKVSGGFIWNWKSLLLAIGPGVGFAYALMALSKADAGLVTSIGSIHPAITAILAVALLGEKLTGLQMGMILLIIAGAVVMSWPHSAKATRGRPMAWVWWGVGFGLLSGLNNFMSKIGIGLTNTVSYSLMIAWFQITFGLVWLMIGKGGKEVFKLFKKENRIGLVGTGIYNVGSISLFLAIGLGQVSLVMPVVVLYVPLILILAAWWLGEKTTGRQKIGAGVIISSVILLSLIS